MERNLPENEPFGPLTQRGCVILFVAGDQLPGAISAAVHAMAVACEEADGSPPLSEETLLELRRVPSGTRRPVGSCRGGPEG